MKPLSQATVISGRYRLERKLGAGGMGSVWLATDLSLDSTCAIKLVDPEKVGDEEVRIRFQREARAAAQIRSANVVDVFDHGLWEGMPFIVMEYLQGEDLGSRLDRVGRLGLRETYDIVAQVARALVRAHALGIVHRDLKPENIFLVPGDDREVAKVLDFGIAKLDRYSLTDKTTKTGSFMGTPYYMSPEQARGKAIDWRSDLWALGIIVFQCLTGKPPFESEALGELMGMILYDPIPKITDRDSSLAPELQVFWERAVARDREQRFQSAKELADALANAAGLDRREVPTLPPRASFSTMNDSELSTSRAAARDSWHSAPELSPPPDLDDDSAIDPGTGAPLSRTRSSVLPRLSALSARQRKLLLVAGAGTLLVLGAFVVSFLRGGGGDFRTHSGGDSVDAPITAPAAPPVPLSSPKSPPRAQLPSSAPSPSASAPLEEDRSETKPDGKKKRDNARRGGTPVAPSGRSSGPDYGI